MYRKPPKRRTLLKQAIVYATMASSVVLVVTLITLFMLGFRFTSGNLERYGFLQFNSKPSGATVMIDGAIVSSKTPTKSSIPAGNHDIKISRDGYKTWSKSIDIKSGTLTWLNYAILVPEKLNVKSVASYDSIVGSTTSPNSDSILIQKKSEIPEFELIDLSSDDIKTKKISISADLFSKSGVSGVAHTFKVENWDESSRFVLVSHKYDDKSEWLILDTQNISNVKNITQIFDVEVNNLVISSNDGNIFYALEGRDVRKFDISAGTISKPLINMVDSFSFLRGPDLITYIGSNIDKKTVLGLYYGGDEGSTVVRTLDPSMGPFHLSAAQYFNEDFIALSIGTKVEILAGTYPKYNDKNKMMKVIKSFDSAKIVDGISFSPSGEYVFVRSGASFSSYDLEYRKLYSSEIAGVSEAVSTRWLDDSYILSDRDGQLSIREFDGANYHNINPVIAGQAVALTRNGKYIYSFNKVESSYQLQRVLMILP